MSPLMNRNKTNYQRRAGRFVGLVLLLVWLALLGLAAFNRQNIIDWWRLRQYQAPVIVSQLATQDTMTASARKIFYVNHPAIDDKAAFSQSCPNNASSEKTIVLGCYVSNQAGIFLLQVSDARLDGVEQVTAAHEMLHAAYDRLSSSERAKVNAMLQNYYVHDLHDQRILDTIAAYRKSEPHDVVNEMHSVFGSEVSSLPAGLEQYYKRYFSSRAQVTAFAAQYQAAFTSREQTLKQQKRELDNLQSQIETMNIDLKAKRSSLSAKQAQLETSRSNGDVSAYNSGVPVYNSLVVDFNQEIEMVKSLIARYNTLKDSYNLLVLEENQLTNELKSDVTPINN